VRAADTAAAAGSVHHHRPVKAAAARPIHGAAPVHPVHAVHPTAGTADDSAVHPHPVHAVGMLRVTPVKQQAAAGSLAVAAG
jgi:hypothetical protein